MIYRPRLELAIGADLNAPPWEVDYLDMSDPANWDPTRLAPGAKGRLFEQALALPSGRADEASTVAPTSVTLDLDNSDGWLTEGHPLSPWYGQWGQGTAARLSVEAGEPYLLLKGVSGSRASTPHVAALNTPGELFGVVELLAPIWRPATVFDFGSKWGSAGSRSWHFRYDVNDRAVFFWSADGTAELSATSRQLPHPAAGLLAIGWHFLGNNGAGGRRIRFYASRYGLDDLEANLSDRLISETVTAGTSSIFNSPSALDFGDSPGLADPPFPGQLRRFRLRAAPAGTILADLNTPVLTPGATGQTDSAGRVWTFSNAAVTNKQVLLADTVDAIRQKWPYGDIPGLARAQVTVAGPLRRLKQGAKAIGSALFRRVMSPVGGVETVWAYWPCEDGQFSELAYSPIAAVKPGVVNMTYAADNTLPASSPLPQSSQDFGWSFPIPATVSSTEWEITWLVRIPTGATSPNQIGIVQANGSVFAWFLSIDDTDVTIAATNVDFGFLLNTTFPSDPRMFDTWMIVTLSVDQDGADVDWDLDLIPIPGGIGFGIAGTITNRTCGRPEYFKCDTHAAPPDGISFGHAIVTTGASAGWLAPADTAYTGEPDTARAERLAREHGIPILIDGPYNDTWENLILAGAQPLGPQLPLTLTELLEEGAKAGGAILAEDRHRPGGLYYRSRVSMYNQTPKLVIDAALVNPFAPVNDDLRKRNDITATRTNGGSAQRTTDPPPEQFNLYDEQVDVNVDTDLRLGDQAAWRLLHGTTPGPRYESVSINLAAAPDLVARWLRVAEGDMVRVENLPAEHITPEIDQIAQGWRQTVHKGGWGVTINTTPSPPWEFGIRDDDDLAKRDTAGSELDAAYNAGVATTMAVETTLGPFWTTVAAEFPFDVDVGAVRVRVTAIGAPVGQVQTFTVQAAPVNGIVKTVPAGTPVRLWRPTIRGF